MGSKRSRSKWVWCVVSALLVGAGTACVSPRVEVEVESSATRDLREFEVFEWLPMAIVDGAIADDEGLADALSERVFSALVERGFRASPPTGAEGAMSLQLSVRSEFVSKRRISPDPDANFPVTRRVEEAVVALRSLDPESGEVLWRGVARGTLPNRGSSIGRDREGVWLATADALMGRLPER